MSSDLNNGRLLANRYQLVELVGKGAMGRVYQAKDTLLGGVTVAIKFLSQALLNQKMRERFEREATVSALLGEKSIHIVQVRDYGLDENEIPFYVMEYLQGKSLSEIINKSPLPLPYFLSITRQVCLALQCAHQGIVIDNKLYPVVHRDIKPSNIRVIQHIPHATLGDLVKILDFGIATLLELEMTETQSFMGTLAYCSPEQMEGKELDNRSDIYSLGVVMYEMLTGEMPVYAKTNSFASWYKAHHFTPPKNFNAINPDFKIPKALENLIMSCLAKSASDRPQSISEILQALDPLEQRFGENIQLSQRIEETLAKLPVTNRVESGAVTSSADEICLLTSWPKNKPIAEIVFPQTLRTSRESLATLWVMLSKQQIDNHSISTRYNQFLFVPSPHPMVLWITALHNRIHNTRWLPCYLDLKTAIGQEMSLILAQSGCYRILFFALENPQSCVKVMTSSIDAKQRKMLQEWADMSRLAVASNQPQLSKSLLKQEFDKLKPKILIKLETIHSDDSN